MKKALISPIEPRQSGYRVADVTEQEFAVAPPLYWVECANDIIADEYWFDPENKVFFLEQHLQTAAPLQPVTQGAQTL